MRFRIQLSLINPEQNMIPLSYQSEISTWIFKILHFQNSDLNNWLQTNGYIRGKQKFRFFTFSGLQVPEYKVIDDRMIVVSEKISFIFSALLDSSLHKEVIGAFRNQKLFIGDKKSVAGFRVSYVERLFDPEFSNEMTFRSLTPIVISKLNEQTENPKPFFMSPGTPEYEQIFFSYLNKKNLDLLQYKKTGQNQKIFSHFGDSKLDIINTVKSKVLKFKPGTEDEISYKGFLYEFKISAPSELLKIGYYTGFGEKNNLGFGCVDILRKRPVKQSEPE